jgi:hypothetical protein
MYLYSHICGVLALGCVCSLYLKDSSNASWVFWLLDDVSRVGDQLSACSALNLCRLTHVCPGQREEHMHVLG